MGRVVHEDELHVYHVPQIADLSTPTVSEITSDGTDLTPFLAADGVAYNGTRNTASTELLTGKIVQRPGTRGYAPTLTGLRDDESDDFWDEFAYGQRGHLVVSPVGVPESGSKVHVFKGAAQEPSPENSSANTFQRAVVEFPAEDWDLDATVANGG